MSTRLPVRFVLPVIALLLVGAVWFVPEPDPPVVAGGSQSVEVRQTVWACPVQSGWTVAAGQVAPGTEAVARPIPPEAAADPVWAQADRWRTAEPGGDALVLEQSGEGSGSVGYVAGRLKGDPVLGACPPVVDEAWFAGLGDRGRSDATITLINLGENRAVADLTWWGVNGPIQSLDTSGLVVEAGQRREIAVDEVAAGEGVVAAHVSRRRGALTAVALDAGPGGADLLTPAAGPATEQVLAGLPEGDTTRIALANPGTSTAHVGGGRPRSGRLVRRPGARGRRGRARVHPGRGGPGVGRPRPGLAGDHVRPAGGGLGHRGDRRRPRPDRAGALHQRAGRRAGASRAAPP